MTLGYSDPINHALAFAAKHHDQEVRKGTRLPYLTQPANVAIILTRYGRDEHTVLAGILLDVIADWVLEGKPSDVLERRIGDKFGPDVVATALAAAERRYDDDGVELSAAERKDDLLARLAAADERARWVVAATVIHTGSTLLADLRRTDFPEAVWARSPAGREATVRWYRRVHDRLGEVGFGTPIMHELRMMVEALEDAALGTRPSGLGARPSPPPPRPGAEDPAPGGVPERRAPNA